MRKVKGVKHIMNFMDSDTVKLDRVCRMLRSIDGISYSVTEHADETGKVLWAYGTTKKGITKALHAELKALAIGVVFAIDHADDMVGFPKAQFTNTPRNTYGGENAFVTLPSEERL